MSPLDPAFALRLMQAALGASLIVQTLEFMRLRHALGPGGVWAWTVQSGDLAHASRPVRAAFGWLAGERVDSAHLTLRLAAAVGLLFGSALPVSLFLFVGTVALLIRWRGAFNGGSDFMTIVVLTGVVIADAAAALGHPDIGARAGLWYVAIHAISSYFISGAVKLINPEWRSGTALPIFLDGGVYGPLPATSPYRNKTVAALCSWGFILWECSFPLALADPLVAVGFCATAAVFHLLVFRYFGLNRFVFAWLATFPAIVFAAGQA